MTEPMVSELIGYLLDTDAAKSILAGNYEIPANLDPYITLLIQELCMPASIWNDHFAQTCVTTNNHIQGWLKQKESIFADSDDLTFSHYKAGVTEDLIAQFDATLCSFPYQHGLMPREWLPMMDVEILKKAGVYDGKMRTILLMNAEFNMNNNKLGQDMTDLVHAAKDVTT
jgi:hypothetical protein